MTLRNAAVLVLVLDRPGGPTVLLTRRTPNLADYPGELVFPGGAADAGDDGPVATALREAREETRLAPSGVQVAGLWPPRALPDSGFLVTPVIAWSADPAFPGATNLAEVEAVAEVALRGRTGDDGFRETRDEVSPAPDGARYGRMTADLLDLLVSLLDDRR